MSEILFDLIGLVVEVIIDAADSNRRSKRKKYLRNTDFLSVKEPKKYDTFSYDEPILEDEDVHKSIFGTSPTNNRPEDLPKSYSNPFVAGATKTNKTNYDSPLREPRVSSTTMNEQSNISQEYTEEHSICNTQANQVKLEILLLSYMFKEDDGKISGSEKRAIKKHFSKFKGIFEEQDIRDIKRFDGIDKSLINIRAFISQNHVTEGDISDAIRTLKDIERGSNRYGSVISRIESSLLEAMGY